MSCSQPVRLQVLQRSPEETASQMEFSFGVFSSSDFPGEGFEKLLQKKVIEGGSRQ
jgi:hypothetical protein